MDVGGQQVRGRGREMHKRANVRASLPLEMERTWSASANSPHTDVRNHMRNDSPIGPHFTARTSKRTHKTRVENIAMYNTRV